MPFILPWTEFKEFNYILIITWISSLNTVITVSVHNMLKPQEASRNMTHSLFKNVSTPWNQTEHVLGLKSDLLSRHILRQCVAYIWTKALVHASHTPSLSPLNLIHVLKDRMWLSFIHCQGIYLHYHYFLWDFYSFTCTCWWNGWIGVNSLLLHTLL